MNNKNSKDNFIGLNPDFDNLFSEEKSEEKEDQKEKNQPKEESSFSLTEKSIISKPAAKTLKDLGLDSDYNADSLTSDDLNFKTTVAVKETTSEPVYHEDEADYTPEEEFLNPSINATNSVQQPSVPEIKKEEDISYPEPDDSPALVEDEGEDSSVFFATPEEFEITSISSLQKNNKILEIPDPAISAPSKSSNKKLLPTDLNLEDHTSVIKYDENDSPLLAEEEKFDLLQSKRNINELISEVLQEEKKKPQDSQKTNVQNIDELLEEFTRKSDTEIIENPELKIHTAFRKKDLKIENLKKSKKKLSTPEKDENFDNKKTNLTQVNDLTGKKTLVVNIQTNAYLEDLDGKMPWKKFALFKPKIEIGRGEGCELCLKDTSCSRRHAVIINKNGIFYLLDLKSKNGVLVNSRKDKITRLNNRDELQIGDFRFRFLFEKPDETVYKSLGGIAKEDIEKTEIKNKKPALVEISQSVFSPKKLFSPKKNAKKNMLPKPVTYAALAGIVGFFVYDFMFNTDNGDKTAPANQSAYQTGVEDIPGSKLTGEQKKRFDFIYSKAKQLFENQEYEPAKMEFEKALKMDMESVVLNSYYNRVRYAIKINEEISIFEDEKIKLIERRKEASALLFEGKKFFESQEDDHAIVVLKKVLELDPDNKEANSMLQVINDRNSEEVKKETKIKVSQEEWEKGMAEVRESIKNGELFQAIKLLKTLKDNEYVIEKKLDLDIDEQIKNYQVELDSQLKPELESAKVLNENGDKLNAYGKIKEILKKNEDYEEARKIYNELREEFNVKAKKHLSTGKFKADLIEDMPGAIQEFEACLKILEPEDETYKKCNEQLLKIKKSDF